MSIGLKWLVFLGVLCLAVATLISMSKLDRFYVVDQQLLKDPEFQYGQTFWSQKNSSIVTFANKKIIIENDSGASDEISQFLDVQTPTFVRLSVDAGGKEIISGEKFWTGGSVAIMFYGSNGDWLGFENILKLKSSSSMRRYSGNIYLGKDVSKIGVALRFLKAGGRLSVENPKLSLLKEFPAYKMAKIALMICWILVGAGLLYGSLRLLSSMQLALSSSLLVLSMIGVLSPGPIITSMNKYLAELLPEVVLNAIQKILELLFGVAESSAPFGGISKFGHFAIFLLIGVAIGWAFRQVGVLYGAAIITAFAISTEALQMLTYGRSTSITDVYIDLSGGIIGLVVGVISVMSYRRLRTILKNNSH